MRLNLATVKRLVLVGLMAAVGVTSCNSESVDSGENEFKGLNAKKKKKSSGKDEDADIILDENEVGSVFGANLVGEEVKVGSKSDDDPTEDVVPEDVDIGALAGVSQKPEEVAPTTFPSLTFNGSGTVSCKGKLHNTFASTRTTLTTDKLDLDLFKAFLDYDGKGKAKNEANKKIQESLGVTSYRRPSKDERKKLIEKGFDFAQYAIWTTGVTKTRQGQQYNFDPPIPVFPWPGPASRFKALQDSGPKSFKTKVTGMRNFDLTMTVSIDSISGDEIKIRFVADIEQDKPGTGRFRQMYEDFTLPREAVYTINAKALDIRVIDSESWFNGEKCDNRPEAVNMVYRLCKKTEGEKSQTFSCN